MKKFFITIIVLATLSIHPVFASEVKDPNIFDNVDDAVAYALDQFDYDVHANYRVTWENGEYILYWILQDGASYEGQLRESTSEEETTLEESTTTLEESTRPIFESITTKEETTEEESTSPPTTEYTTQETPPLSEFKPDPIITWLKRLIYLIAAIIILVLILLLIGLFKPSNKPRH